MLLTGSDSAFAQSSVRPPANATTNTVPRAGTPTSVPGVRADAPENPKEGKVPGGSLGNRSQSDFWRALREGATGTVSIPDKKAGQVIRGTPTAPAKPRPKRAQAAKAARRGRARPKTQLRPTLAIAAIRLPRASSSARVRWQPTGAYALGGTLASAAHLLPDTRGRIKVEHGLSG